MGTGRPLLRTREAWIYYRDLRELYGRVGFSRRHCLKLVRRFWGSLLDEQ